jgi:hypothetical protein
MVCGCVRKLGRKFLDNFQNVTVCNRKTNHAFVNKVTQIMEKQEKPN